MKIFRANQVREADNYTIKNEPILSINLMERAAKNCTKKIVKLYPKNRKFKIFAGIGNNGGDGLVIARLLHQKGYNVEVFIVKFSDKFSDDFSVNLKRLESLQSVNIEFIESINQFPEISEKDIIIDAIFGSGLTRILSGFVKQVVEKINSSEAEIIAVDIPSGLYGEENHKENQTIINATHTLTFEYPFLSFFYPENEKFIGNFYTISIGVSPEFIEKTDSNYYFIEQEDILSKINKRNKFSHKGTFGHALIIAGSYGKAGAGVLSVKAAHRTGAGLVTALVSKCNRQVFQISSPETMLEIDKQKKHVANLPDLKKYNAVAIGPAIGFADKTKKLLNQLIKESKKPLVIDADAITIFGENKEMLKNIPKNSIFTPHPREFERIAGSWKNDFERNNLQIEFSKKYSCFVVLKGAYTSITTPSGKCYFNSTGSPALATGGSGDVLTGMIVALLAQKYNSEDAVLIAVYLHGKAGEKAGKQKSEDSVIASDIIENIKLSL